MIKARDEEFEMINLSHELRAPICYQPDLKVFDPERITPTGRAVDPFRGVNISNHLMPFSLAPWKAPPEADCSRRETTEKGDEWDSRAVRHTRARVAAYCFDGGRRGHAARVVSRAPSASVGNGP